MITGPPPKFYGTRDNLSYLSTAAKHGLHFFDALIMLTEGRPWIPAAA